MLFRSNYERAFGSIKEDWWDDKSPEQQAQYIKDHPNSKQAQQAGGDDEGGGDNSERLGQIAQERAAAEQEMADAEEMGDKAAYADAQEKIDDLDKEEAELGGSGEQEPSGEGDGDAAYPDGNAPPEVEPEYMSRPHEIEEMIEKLEEYKIHLNKWAGTRVGKTGLENKLDSKVIGDVGYKRYEVNAYGKRIKEISINPGKADRKSVV